MIRIASSSLRVIFVCLCWLILFVRPNEAFSTTIPNRRTKGPLVVGGGGGWKKIYYHHPLLIGTQQRPLKKVSLWNNNSSSNSSSEEMVDWIKIIGKSNTWIVSAIFFVTFAIQRDAFIISFWIGSIMNAILSKVLKKILNIERPTEYWNNADIKLKPSDKGMPSNHAMSLGFIGSFTILFTQSPISITLILPYVFLSLWYRIRAGLHTTDQVIVGWTLGTLHATLWYYFIQSPLMTFLSQYILPSNGIMPIPFLLIPLLVGVAIIGSFERRITQFLSNKQKQ